MRQRSIIDQMTKERNYRFRKKEKKHQTTQQAISDPEITNVKQSTLQN